MAYVQVLRGVGRVDARHLGRDGVGGTHLARHMAVLQRVVVEPGETRRAVVALLVDVVDLRPRHVRVADAHGSTTNDDDDTNGVR